MPKLTNWPESQKEKRNVINRIEFWLNEGHTWEQIGIKLNKAGINIGKGRACVSCGVMSFLKKNGLEIGKRYIILGSK